MNYTIKLILFLIINFAALAIGGLFTAKAVNADWYLSLNKAPWTPPGWVFGAAWTFIMITFSFFMAKILPEYKADNFKIILFLFSIQWILNVIWNPIFFKYHQSSLGLVVIISLTFLVYYFTYYGFKNTPWYMALLMLPYAIWLTIATSLNAYILLKN